MEKDYKCIAYDAEHNRYVATYGDDAEWFEITAEAVAEYWETNF